MSYYDEHAQRYIETTAQVDMSEQYALFLPYLSPGARILDAGCGSGRDSLAFLQLGYEVTAFDASAAMVEAATALTGLSVQKIRFEELEAEDRYDGIWASASLLHVQKEALADVFVRLHRALIKGGILYASFKEREEDFTERGRHFSCFTPEEFKEFIESGGLFSILRLETSYDLRPNRASERWLNAALRAR